MAASRIEGHRPRLPRHQQSLETCDTNSINSNSAVQGACRRNSCNQIAASSFGAGEMDKSGGLVLLTLFCSVPISKAWKDQIDKHFRASSNVPADAARLTR